MMKRFDKLLLISILAALPACTDQEPSDPGPDDPAMEAVEMPADWIGYSVGVSPPRLRRMYQATNVVEAREDDPPSITEVIPVPDTDEVQHKLMAMGPDGTVYEVHMPPQDLERIGREMKGRELNGASLNAGPPTTEKGWSNGIDSRERWYNSSSDWPRDTMGRLSAGCTGTLFDDRLVLTAFHCLWDGYGNWVSSTFYAGQDGSTFPYAGVSHTWKYWDQGFVDNNCHKWRIYGYTSTCEKYDWAVYVLAQAPQNASGGTPGYMGFYYSSDSAVAGFVKYHYGYPGCSSPGAPDGCVSGSLWGQSFSCQTGSFFGSVGGWNRNFYHGCDMSGGHSGGPLYSWTPGSNGPYIVATNIAETCQGAACSSQTPNVAFRIDQWLGDNMLNWRSQY